MSKLYQDVLKNYINLEIISRRLGKTSWRRLEGVWPRWIYWSWWRRLENAQKKYSENLWVRRIYSSWSRRLEDVLKTSSEDVFWRRRRKTSSRHLQDFFIKSNVFWVLPKASTLIFIATKNLNKNSYFYSYKAQKNKSGSYLIFF